MPRRYAALRYPLLQARENVIDAEIDVLRELGVDIHCGVEVGKDVTLAELRRQGYKAFYIAIGCQGGRKAGVPGEDAAGIETAVHLLRTVGGDGSRKMTGKTVVIGGGNVAIDAARVSLRCGSDGVTMVCLEPRRRCPPRWRKSPRPRRKAPKSPAATARRSFSENGHVTAVVLKSAPAFTMRRPLCTHLRRERHHHPALRERCAQHRPVHRVGRPTERRGRAAGPRPGRWADMLTYQTAQPDVFVGGDVYTGPRFAIDAIAAGKQGQFPSTAMCSPTPA